MTRASRAAGRIAGALDKLVASPMDEFYVEGDDGPADLRTVKRSDLNLVLAEFGVTIDHWRAEEDR